MGFKSHLTNMTNDTLVALITLEIPRVWELCVRNKAKKQMFISYINCNVMVPNYTILHMSMLYRVSSVARNRILCLKVTYTMRSLTISRCKKSGGGGSFSGMVGQHHGTLSLPSSAC